MSFKRKLHNFFIGGRRFQQEFRRQMRLLIIVTIGFTVAFTWRQTIFDAVQTLVTLLTGINGQFRSSLLTSLAITLLGLIIIFITSHILKEEQ